ncbi:hypothetical protein E4S40_07340 [Algoriphagus kandeliae]|uniref:Uncharacterized protein n=1 Tax=Algoriphagus kandeliae TaxID=2562278 RepID=A0A4Y9QWL4_9BACT|nr:hypothetical protein [Algoriphagus kandeliae]TFV96032.1 hypothetical protein E4S40_07340 [Algoriphagus kandeliae]
MKRLFLIIIIAISCDRKSETQNLDIIVDELVLAEINQFNSSLWDQIENRFYEAIGEPLWMNKSKIELLADFMYSHHVMGYPSSFALNDLDSNLLNELNKIGFTKNDDAAHVFIHSTIAEKVNSINFRGDMKKEAPMIFSYSAVDPDSLSLSFSLMDYELHRRINEKDLERTGLYKLTVLFYFSELIKRKN